MHNIVLRNSWLVAMQIWFGFQSNGMGLGHYCDTQVDQDIYQSLQSSKVKIKKNIHKLVVITLHIVILVVPI